MTGVGVYRVHSRRGLAALTAGQVTSANALFDEVAQHLQTARERIDRGRDKGISETFLLEVQTIHAGLLGRLEGLANELSLVDSAEELSSWEVRLGDLDADTEVLNQRLLEKIPGELSRRNLRVTLAVLGTLTLVGGTLWVLYRIGKTWWVK